MAQDDFKLHNYQDDVDTEGTDPVVDELTDHPADDFQVPAEEREQFEQEFGDEIDKLNIEGDSQSVDDDDEREAIEDAYENL